VDGEKLFCWHVIPLDVYLENEQELSTASTAREIVEGLKGTVGEKLLSMDKESRVVVNFHGVSTAFFSVSSRFLAYLIVYSRGLYEILMFLLLRFVIPVFFSSAV
jgi:hypothetical protein